MTAPALEVTDYHHKFHAGNVGDVFKHCVLVAALKAAANAPKPVRYLETHAGEGWHSLGPTGEWTEGVGRLRGIGVGSGPAAFVAYVEALRALSAFGANAHGYPGSPLLALGALRPTDSAVLYELDQQVSDRLRRRLSSDARAEVVTGDGLAALPGRMEALAATGGDLIVLIDPPYSSKPEWTAVPDALITAHRRAPSARVILWYPIKSLTRPNAMLTKLREAGVPGTALELVTTPLELKRKRLNGSGVLLVNAPPELISDIAGASPLVGAACATHDGRWSTRALSWT